MDWMSQDRSGVLRLHVIRYARCFTDRSGNPLDALRFIDLHLHHIALALFGQSISANIGDLVNRGHLFPLCEFFNAGPVTTANGSWVSPSSRPCRKLF